MSTLRTQKFEKIQQSTVTVSVAGQLQKIPIELRIIETVHADGRKDCKIFLPTISLNSKNKAGQ